MKTKINLKKFIAGSAIAVTLLGASAAQAVPILTDIRLTGGADNLISGTLNGVAFTDQPWLLEGQGDLSTAAQDTVGADTGYVVSASSVTVTIGTGGTPTALAGNWQFVSFTFAGDPNAGAVGFCDRTGQDTCLGGAVLGDGSLQFDPSTISLPYTASGGSLFNDGTFGVLVVNNEGFGTAGAVCIGEVANCGTFTTSGSNNPDPNPNAVPEPATGGMVMLGMTGLAWFARRRKV